VRGIDLPAEASVQAGDVINDEGDIDETD